jgi:hypothetical protein
MRMQVSVFVGNIKKQSHLGWMLMGNVHRQITQMCTKHSWFFLPVRIFHGTVGNGKHN